MPLPMVYHRDYVIPLPGGYSFPMPKFGMLRDRLLAEGVARAEQFHQPRIAPLDWLTRVHEPAYVRAFCRGELDPAQVRRIGLPWSTSLVRRTRTAVGGTVLTARLALSHGMACNTAGGTHHAFPAFGAGYCIFNDLAIAARIVRHEGLANRVLILDLDVHQGDGTARVFQDDPSVFTASLHCARNFPLRKQRSDLDVALPPGTGDEAYLRTLAGHLSPLLDRFHPDLVLYDAGVDPHVEDRLGKLSLSDQGLRRRDRLVLNTCADRGLPLAAVIGGGYGDDLHRLTRRHAILHQEAGDVYEQKLA